MKKFLFIVFVFSLLQGFAQQYNFKNYGLDEGLSQSDVLCIYQDASGNIWTGTAGGLNKFDGKQFVTFTKEIGRAHV